MNKNREITRRTIKDYLIFNRNILIGFAGAFLTSAGTSQVIARFTSPLVNSLISLVAELSVFLAIFCILFYFDNKDKFVDEQGKRRESGRVKWVLLKLASTLSIAEIEYNTVKPAIHFWLLTLDYQPFIASTIASFITIIGYLAVADSMAYLTRLFKKP
ncbi:MAG TPA: hypothetical protein VIP70_06635 [Nitrososphaeraceae archaeon]